MFWQTIDIDGYWQVTAIYLPREEHMPMVAEALERIGCPWEDVEKTVWLLSNMWNKGATYSNMGRRRSVMVIGKATSWEQFFDTVLHEVKHVGDDIVMAYDVMNYGEPPAYLHGYIGRQMAPVIRQLALA